MVSFFEVDKISQWQYDKFKSSTAMDFRKAHFKRSNPEPKADIKLPHGRRQTAQNILYFVA